MRVDRGLDADVAIVGAGPAGGAAALAILRKHPAARVLILERQQIPRDKVCGDGIAPHALDVLAGLGLPTAGAGFRPVRRLEMSTPGGPSVGGDMARAALVIPREVFDARITSAAVAAGATFVRHRVRRVEAGPRRVVVDGDVAVRTVIAADGAHSAVRRHLGLRANPSGHVAVALRGYAPVPAARADAQVIAFAARDKARTWPAYAWSFPIGDGRANVGYGELVGPSTALTRAGMIERLEELLPGAATGATEWRAHHLPLSSWRPRQPDGPVLLCGDALSLVNPLTGEGIYYAVLSGALAGAAAAAAELDAGGDPGRRYRRALSVALGRHLRHTGFVARLVRHQPVTTAALRAAAESAGVFEDLVEIGLGRGLLTRRILQGVATSRLPGALAGPGPH